MKYLCPRDFRRGEMEERMKKLLLEAFLGFEIILPDLYGIMMLRK